MRFIDKRPHEIFFARHIFLTSCFQPRCQIQDCNGYKSRRRRHFADASLQCLVQNLKWHANYIFNPSKLSRNECLSHCRREKKEASCVSAFKISKDEAIYFLRECSAIYFHSRRLAMKIFYYGSRLSFTLTYFWLGAMLLFTSYDDMRARYMLVLLL